MIHVTLKDFGQRPIGGASILVDRTRLKQLFHTSQNRPSCCAFYWVTNFSSANRVSGWLRGRNIGGVTGELRRLGLTNHRHRRIPSVQRCVGYLIKNRVSPTGEYMLLVCFLRPEMRAAGTKAAPPPRARTRAQLDDDAKRQE